MAGMMVDWDGMGVVDMTLDEDALVWLDITTSCGRRRAIDGAGNTSTMAISARLVLEKSEILPPHSVPVRGSIPVSAAM
jgi:hypothetical protein